MKKIIIAPRKSGKTLSCLSIFLEDPENTLWIVQDIKHKKYIEQLVNPHDKIVKDKLNRNFSNILSVSQIKQKKHRGRTYTRIIMDEFFLFEQELDWMDLYSLAPQTMYFTGTLTRQVDQKCFDFIHTKKQQYPVTKATDKLVDEFCLEHELDPSLMDKSTRILIFNQFDYLITSMITDVDTELYFLNYKFDKNIYNKLVKTMPPDLLSSRINNNLFLNIKNIKN